MTYSSWYRLYKITTTGSRKSSSWLKKTTKSWILSVIRNKKNAGPAAKHIYSTIRGYYINEFSYSRLSKSWRNTYNANWNKYRKQVRRYTKSSKTLGRIELYLRKKRVAERKRIEIVLNMYTLLGKSKKMSSK
jgi:hypothetical protein